MKLQKEVIIIGGGIAGLWLLADLLARQRNAVLIEQGALGEGQTLSSQGIIHGGTKYALTGKITGASQAIAGMPALWRAALQGKANMPDLRTARCLSLHQYLWTNQNLGGKITSFFASKVMRSRMQRVHGSELPDFLKDIPQAHVYQLEEPVLDIKSVLSSLAQACQGAIISDACWQRDGNIWKIQSGGEAWEIEAEHGVFCAGAGNENQSSGQRRPLHMVIAEIEAAIPPIYGHFMGMSDKPLLTITSHSVEEHRFLYLGGQLAEEGVQRSEDEQHAEAQRLLHQALPQLKMAQTHYYSHFIDRAESNCGGKRPDEPVIIEQQNDLIAWPTKLAFAPLLSQRLIEKLHLTSASNFEAIATPPVRIAAYPWERLALKH